jgi:hypothetical protein
MLPDAGSQRMQQHHNENDSQLQVATHTSGVAADVKICAMALRLLLEPVNFETNPTMHDRIGVSPRRRWMLDAYG